MEMAHGAFTEAEIVQVKEKDVEEEDGLIVCNSCRHLVPRTMVCLYCGVPILLRKPRTLE